MQKPQPFVVPAGVTFQITDAGVIIENEGDIVLHTNFGRALTRIVSRAGSITVHAPVEGGSLRAAGDVSVHGDTRATEVHAGGNVTVAGHAAVDAVSAGGDFTVSGNAAVDALAAGGNVAVSGDASGARLEATGDFGVTGALSGGAVRAGGKVDVGGAAKADTVHAHTVRFAGASVTARGVQASHAVHIGAAKLQVDAIIAPEVHLDPATSGRATIVESHNDLGPNALKGGFRLADYAEMFGDPASFLSERGLAPIGTPVAAPSAPAAPVAAAPVSEAPVAASPVAEAAPVVAAVAAAVAAEPEVNEAPAVEIEEPADEPVEVEAAEPAEVDIEAVEVDGDPATAHGEAAPVSMEVEESEEVAPARPPEHPLHKQLVEAVTRIAESYADAELPPAVNHLMSLIETRSYDQVRAEITAIWSDLLKYHQKKGLRIQHQVTTTFNTINSLVKKM